MSPLDPSLDPVSARKTTRKVPNYLDEDPTLELVEQGLRVAEDEKRDAADLDAESEDEELQARPPEAGERKESQLFHMVKSLIDVQALEAGIVKATTGILGDIRIERHPALNPALSEIIRRCEHRKERVAQLVEDVGGHTMGGLKVRAAEVDGFMETLVGAGMRSRSSGIRGLIVALNAETVAYDVVLTIALALNDERVGSFAASALKECAGQVLELTDLLPFLLIEEISASAAVPNAAAAQEAARRIRACWNHQMI